MAKKIGLYTPTCWAFSRLPDLIHLLVRYHSYQTLGKDKSVQTKVSTSDITIRQIHSLLYKNILHPIAMVAQITNAGGFWTKITKDISHPQL